MPPTQTQLTLMFIDVCHSTCLYELLGDAEAQRKINQLLGALRTASEALGGRAVKEIGDESMLVFEHCEKALALAREQGATPLLLRREQHRLLHAGSLHLTPSDPDDPRTKIHYRVQPAH